MIRQVVFLLVLSAGAWAQARPPAEKPASPPEAAGQVAAAPSATEAGDDLAQMRIDLNQMESLLNNMSSEITFLRDQNLQILLRSNARMWTILIRDLRLQIEREERSRAGRPANSEAKPRS
jgi:hypothetical protein